MGERLKGERNLSHWLLMSERPDPPDNKGCHGIYLCLMAPLRLVRQSIPSNHNVYSIGTDQSRTIRAVRTRSWWLVVEAKGCSPTLGVGYRRILLRVPSALDHGERYLPVVFITLLTSINRRYLPAELFF
jgi:hypothetical protein